ncbi:MAG: ATP-dependent helicase [Gammaproteobacteria bacterium]|nr:MAG: ATP-dependent helicase [Gammaproteobacteria bacterium]
MTTKTTFKDLGLNADILTAINKKGFEEPTAIQATAIPAMLDDKLDIIAQAQTGTGKTASFGLPLIQLINPQKKEVQALILAPTRELAIQVAEEISTLKPNNDLQIVPIYGGQSIDQQLRRLRKGAHIVVGTPGRVIDHLRRKTLNIKNIAHLILDEADEMLNMGFIDDMKIIMGQSNENKKTLLFSATMPTKIKDLAKKYMQEYTIIATKQEQLTTNLTEQIYFQIKPADKFEALCRIIDFEDNFYGLVFARTKSDVDYINTHLNNRGYDSGAIHGDIIQNQREKILRSFRNKQINILVATDVAARGIDVNNLSHVINYSLPHDPESYVHRIGRTGRAGNRGTAITFITSSEYRQLSFIQRIAKIDIKKSKLPQIDDIIENRKKKILDDLNNIQNEKANKHYHKWAYQICEDKDPIEVVSAMLHHCFGDEINPNSYKKISDSYDSKNNNGGRDRNRNSGGDRNRDRNRDRNKQRNQVDQQGKARLFIALGKKDQINARKLASLITDKVDIKNHQINDIEVLDKFSFMSVPFSKAEQIIKKFKQNGKKSIVTLSKKSKK